MLYHLLPQFADVHIIFNLFRFITFRAAGAVVTSLVLAFLLGPVTIRGLRRLRVGQADRSLRCNRAIDMEVIDEQPVARDLDLETEHARNEHEQDLGRTCNSRV